MPFRRFVVPFCLAGHLLSVPAARAVVYEFDTSISSSDQVLVTMILLDAPEGSAVNIQVSIPSGEGDILGVFGNVLDEAIVPTIRVDHDGAITQSSFTANAVWKVGGGNNLNPAPKMWDWGVRIGNTGSQDGAVEAASFRLSAPGLTTAQLLAANNGGWILGVRIQSTTGSEGSAKIGLSDTLAPVVPPVLRIESPLDETLLANTPVIVQGHIIGGTAIAVNVNGVPATLVSGGAFTAEVPLSEGNNPLLAQAQTLWGPLADLITVELDTSPPIVEIELPATGLLTAESSVVVSGSVFDASAIGSFVLQGQELELSEEGHFNGPVFLTPGSNTIVAMATDILGHTGSDSIEITRGEQPAVHITSPANGALLPQAEQVLTGTVSGTPPIALNVKDQTITFTENPFSIPVTLEEGQQVIQIIASNALGNATDSVQVTVDTLPPVIALQTPTDGIQTENTSVAVTGTITDASAIVELTVGGVAVAPGNAFALETPLEVGTQTLTIEAKDAARHIGTANVSVTRIEAGEPVVITIASPVDGQRTASRSIDVAGQVDPMDAIVRVNGVLATVIEGRFIATAIPLSAEGANTLTAIAEKNEQTASAQVTVVYDEAPIIYISRPRNGDVLRSASVDVEGTVNDVAALVDVNGVVANVDGSGHFIATGVALELGENELSARAVDPQGSSSEHSIMVNRDDAAPRNLRAVYVNPYRYTLSDYLESGGIDLPEWSALVPWNLSQIAAQDSEAFKDELARLEFPPEHFTTPIEDLRLGNRNFHSDYLLAFSDEPGDVSFEIGPWSYQEAFVPADALLRDLEDGYLDEFWSIGQSWWNWASLDPLRIDSEAQSRIVPHDFDAKYATLVAVRLDCEDCADEENATVFATRSIVAYTNDEMVELPVYVDTNVFPVIVFDTPRDGSTVSNTSLTVTGRVFSSAAQYNVSQGGGSQENASPRPVFREIYYLVRDGYGTITDEGLAPLANGRFVLSDLILPPEGFAQIRVNAFGASGIRGVKYFYVYVDPSAPRVSLLSPQDGSALLDATANIALNFSEPATLLSVNGVGDGRSFPAGIATDVLQLPLEYGENVVRMEFAGTAGNFSFAFTLYRFASLENLQITSPRQNSVLNTSEILVEGTAPLGTPYIEVNGVAAELLDGGMTFRARLTAPEGRVEITARNPLLGQSASVHVTTDYTPPQLFDLPPGEGWTTTSPELPFAGAATEHVSVQVDSASFHWGGATYADNGFAQLLYDEQVTLAPEQNAAYPFYAGKIPLELGPNAVQITLTDRAGNRTVIDRTFHRQEALLTLIAPASGTIVDSPTVPLTLAANGPLTLDMLYVGARRFPAYEGLELSVGEHTLTDILLDEGQNEMRILYHNIEGATAVANAQLTGSVALDLVEGIVVDQRTGQPLSSAQIELTLNSITFIVTSNEQGHFVATVPPGDVVIAASAPGHGPLLASVSSSDIEPITLALPEGDGETFENHVAILVPPAGTVTDWDTLTVVGNVIDPSSTITVNGIAARVIGNRFTATGVPLAMGANTLHVTATSPRSASITTTLDVERSDVAIPLVRIYSPPEGSQILGSGLIVRGFVSSRSAFIELHDQNPSSLQIASDGVFEAIGVALEPGQQTLSVDVLGEGDMTASDSIALSVESSEPALALGIEPSVGPLPLRSNVWIAAYVDGIRLAAIDFDWDGDGVLDTLDAPVSSDHGFTQDRAYAVKAIVTTQEGVEYAVGKFAQAYQPHNVLGASFAHGNPVDLKIDSEGRLYVLDGSAGRVRRFTQEGVEDLQFGEGLSDPHAIALGIDGKLYVADTGNHRIQIYGADGQYENSIGTHGTAPGEFDSPRGIAIDGTALVVADTGNHRIQRIELDGSSHASFSITAPQGVTADSAWGTLVASPSEGLITVTSTTASSLNGYLSGIPSEGSLVAPIDIASGKDGFAVVDAATGSIVVLARGLGYRRIIQGFDARAVVFGARKTQETIFVADGKQVVEIDLPIPSPMPTFETFRQRLGAGDIDAALELIIPINRSRYRPLLEAIASDLPAEAADMQYAYLSRLTRERALIMLPRKQEVHGRMMELVYPMYLHRGEDGQWQIASY